MRFRIPPCLFHHILLLHCNYLRSVISRKSELNKCQNSCLRLPQTTSKTPEVQSTFFFVFFYFYPFSPHSDCGWSPRIRAVWMTSDSVENQEQKISDCLLFNPKNISLWNNSDPSLLLRVVFMHPDASNRIRVLVVCWLKTPSKSTLDCNLALLHQWLP